MERQQRRFDPLLVLPPRPHLAGQLLLSFAPSYQDIYTAKLPFPRLMIIMIEAIRARDRKISGSRCMWCKETGARTVLYTRSRLLRVTHPTSFNHVGLHSTMLVGSDPSAIGIGLLPRTSCSVFEISSVRIRCGQGT